MVAKQLQMPVFDISKYQSTSTGEHGEKQIAFLDIFNEIVYKMAQYYFTVFQAIFSKDNESIRPQIQDFLNQRDVMHRSRKILSYFGK
jgi:hypothetical protein